MITVEIDSIRKEFDGKYIVCVRYKTSTVYGYGNTPEQAKQDAESSLNGGYKENIRVVLG